VKKLGWIPDVIHCHGWMTALLPLYLKTYFKDDPHFSNAKIISSLYENSFEGELNTENNDIFKFDGLKESDYSDFAKKPNFLNLTKTAIDYSDGVVLYSENLDEDVLKYVKSSKIDSLKFVKEDGHWEDCGTFYDKIIEKESTLAK
jgi:starch synthase